MTEESAMFANIVLGLNALINQGALDVKNNTYAQAIGLFQSSFPTTTSSVLQTESESRDALINRNAGITAATSAATLTRVKPVAPTAFKFKRKSSKDPRDVVNTDPFANVTHTPGPSQAPGFCELHEENASALRAAMLHPSEQLYSAEQQLRVRNSLVYNQAFKIAELQ